MICTNHIIQLKREVFHVNIRRQRNEKLFKEQRLVCIQKMFNQQGYLQEMSMKIRDKIENNQTLSPEELETMINRIHSELGRENHMNLLDTIDAAVWMLKSVDCMVYDEICSDNLQMLQIIGQMISLSQGYWDGSDSCSQQIIIYAAKFIKYWTQVEDQCIYKFYGSIAETIYFLLNKSEPLLIKRGVDILFNLATFDQGKLLPDLYSLIIFGQNLVKPICNLLLSNENFKIQTTLWNIVLESFLADDREGMNQYLSFSQEVNQQKLSFFQILRDSSLESELKNLKLLKVQLHLIHCILDHCEQEDDEKYKQYVQDLKNQDFAMTLERKWLFHKWNSIANVAHEIQLHLHD